MKAMTLSTDGVGAVGERFSSTPFWEATARSQVIICVSILFWEATARSQVITFFVWYAPLGSHSTQSSDFFLCGTLFWEATARSQVITFFVWYALLGSYSTQSSDYFFCVVRSSGKPQHAVRSK